MLTDTSRPHPDPTAPFRTEALDVLVVGAGQAGLALAYHLREAGLRSLVVDGATEIGASWRNRWDSLRLFTPAQYDGLPGMPFPAPPDTYPTRTQVADYLQAYVARFELPVLLGTTVTRLVRDGDVFAVHTDHGLLHARQVVVATGPFQTPVVPAVGTGLGPGVQQLHSAAYRNPAQIADGPVLVVGAGNSGRQIALELAAAHDVALAVGTGALELPQRMLGRDLFWWLLRLGLLATTADSRLARRMRARGDLVIGSRLSELRDAGVDVRPRLTTADGGRGHVRRPQPGPPGHGHLGHRVPARPLVDRRPGRRDGGRRPAHAGDHPGPGADVHRPALAAHPRLGPARLRQGGRRLARRPDHRRGRRPRLMDGAIYLAHPIDQRGPVPARGADRDRPRGRRRQARRPLLRRPGVVGAHVPGE